MNPITKLTLILWTIYFLGVLAHILLRAGYAIRNPANPIASRWTFIERNWDVFLVRTIISSVLFGVWLNHPGLLSAAVGYFGWHLNFDIPVSNAVAFGFGYLFDSLLDSAQSFIASIPKLAWLNTILRGQVPNYNGVVPEKVAPSE